MKSKLISIVSVVGFTTSVSFGALYTVNNGTGNTASGFITSGGGTFRSASAPPTTNVPAAVGDAFSTGGGIWAGPGVVAFGYFTTDVLAGLTKTQLVSSFVQFGNAGAFALNGTTGNRSVYSSPQNVTVLGSTFDTKSIYVFAGNGTSFNDSTEFSVAKSAFTFNSSDDSATAPISLVVRPANSTVLFGTLAANVQTANTDASTTPGWTMAAPVPEPSVALLGVLGVLGLLRRRRN